MITLICICALLLFATLLRIFGEGWEARDNGVILTVFGCIFLAIFLALWPMIYVSRDVDIRKYQAFKGTIDHARIDDLSELERATILKDVAKWNEWIAEMQFLNKKFHYDPFIPDEIDKVSPLY